MPDLFHTLQGHDLGFLKIVAETWGIELNAPDAHTALPRLVSEMLDAALAEQIVAGLPDQAAVALEALLDHEGRIPWAMFTRQFGEVRIFGTARRDREKPEKNPISPAEILWYRGLIGKAFLNFPPEPQEFAYIPDDLLEFLGTLRPQEVEPLGRAASPGEIRWNVPATDQILDDCCTLLAALRTGKETLLAADPVWKAKLPFLLTLIKTAGLVGQDGTLQPESIRGFLETSRGQALAALVTQWLNSSALNELLLVPDLVFEGEWQNNPLHTRQIILEFVNSLPKEIWWNLPAFIAAIRKQYSDFQRPAGDYDSWFIRKRDSDLFLRGISSWDEVDGALLRYMITGPLHWLGLVDLASDEQATPPLAFRASSWASLLLSGQAPVLPQESDTIEITLDRRFKVSRLTSRAVRYQIARFCEWEEETGSFYFYRITAASLEKAQKQGLLTAHLIKLLHRVSSRPIPPALIQAIERWDRFGVEAGLQQVILLRFSSPEILEALRKTRAGRALLETLNPTTVILRPGSEEIVRKELEELGYLSDSRLSPGKRV